MKNKKNSGLNFQAVLSTSTQNSKHYINFSQDYLSDDWFYM